MPRVAPSLQDARAIGGLPAGAVRLRHLRLILGDDASGTHEYTDAEVLAGSSGYSDEALARLVGEVRGMRAIMQGRIEVGRWARTSAGTRREAGHG